MGNNKSQQKRRCLWIQGLKTFAGFGFVRKQPSFLSHFKVLIVLANTLIMFYTNVTVADADTLQAQSEITKLDRVLAIDNLPEDVLAALAKNRHFLTSYIAIKQGTRNCQHLFLKDPTMLEGEYTLVPKAGPNAGKTLSVRCERHENGMATYDVKNVLPEQSCLLDHSCPDLEIFTKEISCGDKSIKDVKICVFEGIANSPEVLENQGSAACVDEVNFGYNARGLWTKGGCQANFKVHYRLHPGLLNLKKYSSIEAYEANTEPVNVKSKIQAIAENLLKRDRVRRSLSVAAEIEKQEVSHEVVIHDDIQAVAHGKRSRSCHELKIHTATSGTALPTGHYFLYSGESEYKDRQVNATPTFCDWTYLVAVSSSINRYTYRGDIKKLNTFNRDHNTHSLVPSSVYADPKKPFYNMPVYHRECHTPQNRSEEDGEKCVYRAEYTGYAWTTHCVAKKHVEYLKSGAYSFVRSVNFGRVVVKKDGISYCFKEGEVIRLEPEYFLHAYQFYYRDPGTVRSPSNYSYRDPRDSVESIRVIDMDATHKSDIVVTWKHLGSGFTYTLDVKPDGKQKIAPCYDTGMVKSKTQYVFNGKCGNGKSYSLSTSTKVRVCATQDNNWERGICSPYRKLRGPVRELPLPDPKVELSWNSQGDGMAYRLDMIRINPNGRAQRLEGCIGPKAIGNSTSYVFHRKCVSLTNKLITTIVSNHLEGTKVRVCYGPKGSGNATCGPYVDLGMGQQQLPIPIEGSLALSWDNPGPQYLATINLTHRRLGEGEVKTCVASKTLGSKVGTSFEGVCEDGSSFPLNKLTKLQLCLAPAEDPNQKICSDFVHSLRKHFHFELRDQMLN